MYGTRWVPFIAFCLAVVLLWVSFPLSTVPHAEEVGDQQKSGETFACEPNAPSMERTTIRANNTALDGEYYINNDHTRLFLRASISTNRYKAFTEQGTTSVLGENAIWEFESVGDGTYYIKTTPPPISNSVEQTYYLQYKQGTGTNGYGVALAQLPDLTSINNARWEITQIGSVFTIKNVETQYYLHNTNPRLPKCGTMSTSLPTNAKYWRLVDTGAYQANEVIGFTVSKTYVVTRLFSSSRLTLSQTTPTTSNNATAMFADAEDYEIGPQSEKTFTWSLAPNRFFSIYGLQLGEKSVTIKHIPSGHSCNVTITVVPSTGYAIIRNAQYPRYLTKETNGNVSTRSYLSGDGSQQVVQFVSISSGSEYFKIVGNNSMLLTYTASGSPFFSAQTLASGVVVDEQQWMFEATTENRVRIRSKKDESKVLICNDSNNGLSCVAASSVSDLCADWYLIMDNRTTWAFPGVRYNELVNTVWDLNKQILGTSYGNTNTYLFLDSDIALTSMQNSRVYVFCGHGLQQVVQCNKYLPGQSEPYLTMDDIDDLPDNALSGCRLVAYVTCLAGQGGLTAENMVTATYDKGAQMVIGFDIEIDEIESKYWMEQFLYYLIVQNQTIGIAMDNADRDVRQQYNKTTTDESHQVAIGNSTVNPFSSP